MSEILARIRVRETHGIRRFLYPLSAVVTLPDTFKPGELKTVNEVFKGFALMTAEGLPLPRQIDIISGTSRSRLNFALSLAPGEELEVVIVEEDVESLLPDPLQAKPTADGRLRNTQARFTTEISPEGNISEVIYDNIPHLRGHGHIQRNNETAWHSSTTVLHNYPAHSLFSSLHSRSRYADGTFAETKAELTACKSWVTLTHTLEKLKPNDEIVFTLPVAITSPTLTCDFGVGGYVFGKLDANAAEIVWRTEFGDAPYARWSVATAGRVDYIGQVETAEAFLPQRWFHLIDSDKALAVAVTKLPDGCREMTVRLTQDENVSVAFVLGEAITGPAEFGVCYHFLNDVPAIAAATNPQSILLPPVVEVLPV